MDSAQMCKYEEILEAVARKVTRRFRSVDSDDAAQIVRTAAVETQIEEERSRGEIAQYLWLRLYGAAVDAIRRDVPGLRYGRQIAFVPFSALEFHDNSTGKIRRGDEPQTEAAAYRRWAAAKRAKRWRRDCVVVAERVAKEFSLRNRAILRGYFEEGLTLKGAGQMFGLSESRASQILKSYIRLTRRALESEGLVASRRSIK